MQILALGLPRNGLESLRQALVMLSYSNVWHGFDLPISRPEDCVLWVPLLQAKQRGDTEFVRNYDYDQLFADCECVMDMPPCNFSEELLDFYPDAKVILNRRKDLDAWHRSLNQAAETAIGWKIGAWILWTLSWFDARMFWWLWTPTLSFELMADGKFRENGKQWAEEYYRKLEKRLKQDGKKWLDWEVTDGREPLCKFLGREVPEEPFPRGNKSGMEFEANVKMAVEAMVKRAALKVIVLFSSLILIIALYKPETGHRDILRPTRSKKQR